MDYIHIHKLRVRGKHGVFALERRVEQEFEISAKLSVDTPKAGKSDNLEDTVDYNEIRSKIRTIIEGGSRFLIEKLAEEIAGSILKDERIKSVELTIYKPEVWDDGTPGITITRSR